MSSLKKQNDQTPHVRDRVYEYPCGCVLWLEAASGFRQWRQSNCQAHDSPGLSGFSARLRLLNEAKKSRRAEIQEELRIKQQQGFQPVRRSFAEMASKGGFDL